jgi:hypothetical protein
LARVARLRTFGILRRVKTSSIGRAVVGAALVLASACGPNAAETKAVLQYAHTIKPLAVEGGRVIQTGIKAGLGEMFRGEITPAVFRERAATWRRQMEKVRNDFASAVAPPRLNEAKRLYDDSLAGYVRAIDAFVVASTRPTKAQRDQAISQATPIAEQSDKTFDRATAELKRQLRAVGLDESEAP